MSEPIHPPQEVSAMSFDYRQYALHDAQKKYFWRVFRLGFIGWLTFTPLFMIAGNVYKPFLAVHVHDATPVVCLLFGYALAALLAAMLLWKGKYGKELHTLQGRSGRFTPPSLTLIWGVTVVIFVVLALLIPPLTGAVG